jgi:hypothetical protein
MRDNLQGDVLDGGAKEWLRRIALGRSMATIPESIAFALAAMGFAQKTAGGRFEATSVGRVYLDVQGIAYVPVYPKRT